MLPPPEDQELTNEDKEAAALLRRMLQAQAKLDAQGAAKVPPGYELVRDTPDGGKIYRKPDGQLTFTSPSYATNNQAEIQKMIQGMMPAQARRTEQNREIVQQDGARGAAASAIKGIPFLGEYFDEAVGMMSGDPRAEAALRETTAAYEEQKPLEAFGGQMALGTVATLPLVPFKAAAGVLQAIPTMGQRVLAGLGVGAGTGAVEGAVSGFGAGEGTAEQRAPSAAFGATVGGLFGGALGAAGAPAEAGVRNLITYWGDKPVRDMAKQFGISDDAAKVVLAAIKDGDIPTAQAALQRAGSSSMLAEATPATKNLLDAAIALGSGGDKAQAALVARNLRGEQEMRGAFDRFLGRPEDLVDVQGNIRQGTADQRRALYNSAYSKTIDYSSLAGKELENWLQFIPPEALRYANKIRSMDPEARAPQIVFTEEPDGSVSFTAPKPAAAAGAAPAAQAAPALDPDLPPPPKERFLVGSDGKRTSLGMAGEERTVKFTAPSGKQFQFEFMRDGDAMAVDFREVGETANYKPTGTGSVSEANAVLGAVQDTIKRDVAEFGRPRYMFVGDTDQQSRIYQNMARTTEPPKGYRWEGPDNNGAVYLQRVDLAPPKSPDGSKPAAAAAAAGRAAAGAIPPAAAGAAAAAGGAGSALGAAAAAAANAGKPRTALNVEQWDLITRGLNEMAYGSPAGVMGGKSEVQSLAARNSREIRKLLMDQVPEYRAALGLARDTIEEVKSAEIGFNLLNGATTVKEVKDMLSGKSPAVAQSMKLGLRSGLDHMLGNLKVAASNPNTEIKELMAGLSALRSRNNMAKVRALLGDADADAFYAVLDEQATGIELASIVATNSKTAQRQAVGRSVEEIAAPGIYGTMLRGEPVNASRMIVQSITGKTPEADAARRMGLYDDIATVLTRLQGQSARDALELIRQAKAGKALNDVQARIIAKAATTPAAIGAYKAITAGQLAGQNRPPVQPYEVTRGREATE